MGEGTEARHTTKKADVLRRRLVPVAITWLVAIACLAPGAKSLPQHGDERLYVWKAAYYGDRLARLDFHTPQGAIPYLDPGWAPLSFWTVEQPLGSHLVYAAAMAISHTPGPALPYSYDEPALQGPETEVPPDTLIAVRSAAILCSATGLALLAWRLGWRGALAAALLLAIPHVRADLARAWAEGPLLLGFGLCVVSYGSPWFAVACGAAAAMKLTGLGLWPLAFVQGLPCRRFGHILAVVVALLTWTVCSPTSWLLRGPLHLATLLAYRIDKYAEQSATYGGPAGLFVPSRYLWPLELLLILGLVLYAPRFWRRLRAAWQGRGDAGSGFGRG